MHEPRKPGRSRERFPAIRLGVTLFRECRSKTRDVHTAPWQCEVWNLCRAARIERREEGGACACRAGGRCRVYARRHVSPRALAYIATPATRAAGLGVAMVGSAVPRDRAFTAGDTAAFTDTDGSRTRGPHRRGTRSSWPRSPLSKYGLVMLVAVALSFRCDSTTAVDSAERLGARNPAEPERGKPLSRRKGLMARYSRTRASATDRKVLTVFFQTPFRNRA